MIIDIDFSLAFGTIKRKNSIEILESFLREDEIHITRIIFSNNIKKNEKWFINSRH